MSIRWMAQVWDYIELEGSELLLMLALADHANDHGVCWPSIPRLAQRARISERQAQRLIRKLAEAGYLKIVQRGNGRGFTNAYVLLEKGDIAMSPITGEKGDTIASPIPEKRVTPSAKRVTFGANKGDIAMSPDPIEPSIEPRAAQAPAALAVFFEITKCKGNDQQRKVIGEVVTDLERWRRCCCAWMEEGNKPTNVRGMLDWYRDGGPPERKKATVAQLPQTNQQPLSNGAIYKSVEQTLNDIADYPDVTSRNIFRKEEHQEHRQRKTEQDQERNKQRVLEQAAQRMKLS